MKVCECQDWQENIDEINGALSLAFVHHKMFILKKPFNYCPWCGEKLKEVVEGGTDG